MARLPLFAFDEAIDGIILMTDYDVQSGVIVVLGNKRKPRYGD